MRALIRHPAAILGLLSAMAAGLLFQGSGLMMDDTAYLERFLPTLRSWQETLYTPPSLRNWFGPLQRPLTLASLQLDRALWGDAGIAGFHWSQALLYGAVVAAFTALAAALLRAAAPRLGEARRWGAVWVAGALFAVHPAHVETAAWLSTRADLLYALFLLLALRAALWTLQQDAPARRGLGGLAAAGCAALSILSKETGYAAALLIPALLFLRPAPPRGRAALALLVPLAAAVGACFLLRAETPDRPWQDDPWTRWLSALGWAFTNTAFPLHPRLLYDPDPPPAWGIAALLLSAAGLVLAVRAARRGQRLPLFLALFTLATLAPTWVIAWKRIMAAGVSDRYLLLPSGGLLLLAALPLSAPRAAARLALAGFAALFLVCAGRYAAAWAGPPQSLARWTVAGAPLSVTARTCSILRVLRAGDYQTARALFAVQPPPRELEDERSNLDALRAVVLYFDGDWEGALAAALRAAETAQNSPRRWQEYGVLSYESFRELVDERPAGPTLPRLLGEARRGLELAVRYDPRSYLAWETLGRTRATLGDFAGARAAFQQVQENAAGTDAAWLAGLRARLLPDPARFTWDELDAVERELQAQGDLAWRWRGLGQLLHEYWLDGSYHAPDGRAPARLLEQSRLCLEHALERDRGQPAAWVELGLVRATLGDYAPARAAFETARSLDPAGMAGRDAQKNLQRLDQQGR